LLRVSFKTSVNIYQATRPTYFRSLEYQNVHDFSAKVRCLRGNANNVCFGNTCWVVSVLKLHIGVNDYYHYIMLSAIHRLDKKVKQSHYRP
jgi:hypothetical protein